MKIYFVRHGHPDYVNDCLTELGRKQAQAVAERLADLPLDTVLSSTRGRAMQTAEYTAKALGVEVTPCRFMREINWNPREGVTSSPYGTPWGVASLLASQGVSLCDPLWYEKEPHASSNAVDSVKTVAKELDTFLLELGYQREGEYYRVVGDNTDLSVAIFSHGGSSSAALAHLLNIPFIQVCGLFHLDFTSITTVELSNERGALICPKLIGMNDARHIEGLTAENVYGS